MRNVLERSAVATLAFCLAKFLAAGFVLKWADKSFTVGPADVGAMTAVLGIVWTGYIASLHKSMDDPDGTPSR